MSDVIEFGKRFVKDKEDGFKPTPVQRYQLTYRMPDNGFATYSNNGVIKMNGPFIVLVDEDKQESMLQDAKFLLMFEHLVCIERLDEKAEEIQA